MSESARIIELLKRTLKTRGMTYRDLARKVGLSEASIKRVFAEETFKLEQLAREFADFAALDRHLPIKRKRSVALLLAFRPWVFSMFDGLQREHKRRAKDASLRSAPQAPSR